MPKKTTPSSAPKKVVAIRLDLLPRLIEKAKELKQNPNLLANHILEGGLDAMDAESNYESPIVQLYRTLTGKTIMTSKAVMAICSAIIPELYEIEQEQRKILLDLINKHDGPLTPNTLKGYYQLAVQMNKDRLEHKRQMDKIQREQKPRK